VTLSTSARLARAPSATAQAWAVSITPFDEQGRLDQEATRAHFRRLGASGIGIYVGSSNAGEGFTLSEEERDTLFTLAVDELKGRAPVRAGGCEPQSVGAAISYLRAAARAGLDAAHLFQIDTGHAGPPTIAEIERYYAEVFEAAEIPVVISNYPTMGYGLAPDLVARLLKRYPQIVAVRDAGGDIGYLREISAVCAGRADVYTGGIRSLISALFHGSCGFLSAEANLAPALAVSVVDAFAQGDLARLRSEHERLFRLHRFVLKFGGSAGRGIKLLMEEIGLPGGTLRTPRIALSREELSDMVTAWKALGIAH
jgi:4-hydroxy-tetrahydrodipicolinate synthase